MNWKGRLWKEAVVAYFKVLYRLLCEGTEQNHKIFRSGLSVHGLDPNRASRMQVRTLAA
jgi:hypothetical protein